MDDVLTVATECIQAWVIEGIDRAMSRFNARKEPPAEPGAAP